MPFRSLAALLLVALLTGCAAQRDASELENESDLETEAEAEAEEASPEDPMPGGAPPIAVALDGTWNIVLTPQEGGDEIRGMWRIEEGGDNRFIDLMSGAPIDVQERSVSGDVFYVSGVVNSGDGPIPFEVNGMLNGNEMSGDAMLEGLGVFALAGTRRTE